MTLDPTPQGCEMRVRCGQRAAMRAGRWSTAAPASPSLQPALIASALGASMV